MKSLPPTSLAILLSAVSPCITGRHRFIVVSPVKPGLQSCIIESQDGQKKRTFHDAIVVLPASVPKAEDYPNEIYSACFRVLKKDHLKLLAQFESNPWIQNLSGLPWDVPPFIPATQKCVSEHIVKTMSMLFNFHQLGYSTPESAQTALSNAAFWSPQIFATHISRNAPASERHWKILTLWDNWEKLAYDWTSRYESLKQNDCRETAKQRQIEIERFRKLCAWMGLSRITSFTPANVRRQRKRLRKIA